VDSSGPPRGFEIEFIPRLFNPHKKKTFKQMNAKPKIYICASYTYIYNGHTTKKMMMEYT